MTDQEIKEEFTRLLKLNNVTNPEELQELSSDLWDMYYHYCTKLDPTRRELISCHDQDWDKIKKRLRLEKRKNQLEMLRFFCEVLSEYIHYRLKEAKVPFVCHYKGQYNGTEADPISGKFIDGSWTYHKSADDYWQMDVRRALRIMYEDVQFKYFWLEDIDRHQFWELRERSQEEIDEIETEIKMKEVLEEAVEIITEHKGKEIRCYDREPSEGQ